MKVKLLKNKDILETFDDPFNEVNESGIDDDNHVINGVCLFGTKESKNDRIYSNKAVDSLVAMAEGCKSFINHITKEEQKSRSGIRDVRDWLGVFEGARRSGDKVYANLKVREAYWDLMSDIALMTPKGMGLSIDAMVKAYQTEDGKEGVADIVKLRGCDVVASAATTQNLFEGVREKAGETLDSDKKNLLTAYESVIPYTIEDKFTRIMIDEGIIQDKVDSDKLKNEIYDVTYLANDLIREVIYDPNLTIVDKKKKVLDIFSDLDKEVKIRLDKIKSTSNMKEENINKMEFTLEDVKKNKEIMEAIRKEFAEELAVEETRKKVSVLEEEITEIKKVSEGKDSAVNEKVKVIVEKDKKISALESEVKDLKSKLNDFEIIRLENEKKALIDSLIEKSELDKDSVTELFMETLMKVQEDKKDDKVTKTIEEKAKDLIDDRANLLKKNKGKVKNSGDEFIDTKESKTEKKTLTKESLEEAKEKFVFEIK